MPLLTWFLVNVSGGKALAFIVDCISSLVQCCCLHTGEIVPWASLKTFQGPQGMDSFEGINFLVLSFYMYASLTLMCLRVYGRPPLSSCLLYHNPLSHFTDVIPFTHPKSYYDLSSRDKISKASSKMTVQECITSEGETHESKAKKILKNIGLAKKIEIVFHLGKTQSACLLSAYLSLHLLSVVYPFSTGLLKRDGCHEDTYPHIYLNFKHESLFFFFDSFI